MKIIIKLLPFHWVAPPKHFLGEELSITSSGQGPYMGIIRGRRLFHQERKKGGEKSTQITRAGPLSSGGEKERIVKTQIATLHLPAPVQKVPPSQSTGPPFNWSKNMFHTNLQMFRLIRAKESEESSYN